MDFPYFDEGRTSSGVKGLGLLVFGRRFFVRDVGLEALVFIRLESFLGQEI